MRTLKKPGETKPSTIRMSASASSGHTARLAASARSRSIHSGALTRSGFPASIPSSRAAAATAHNRAQVLYYVAENLSARADEFAGRLSYNFNIFGNIFEQVAKFRAGRSLWAKIMKEAVEGRWKEILTSIGEESAVAEILRGWL